MAARVSTISSAWDSGQVARLRPENAAEELGGDGAQSAAGGDAGGGVAEDPADGDGGVSAVGVVGVMAGRLMSLGDAHDRHGEG